MGRRSGFGGLINAVARDLARAQRASVSAQKRAVREQESRRRQYERALRQQQRAQAAHTREMEREAKRQYLEDQMEAAADQTAAFSATVDELEAVLTRTLTADDRIDFESLRLSEQYPPFQRPAELTRAAIEPQRDWFTENIQPPGFLARLIPGADIRHQEKVRASEETADLKYDRALSEYRAGEEKRLAALQAAQKGYEEKRFAAVWKATQRNSEVAEFESRYFVGEIQSVVAYNTMVLERSEYPSDMPQAFRLAYQPASRELVVDYELPGVAIIPTAIEIRYITVPEARGVHRFTHDSRAVRSRPSKTSRRRHVQRIRSSNRSRHRAGHPSILDLSPRLARGIREDRPFSR